MLKIVTFNIRCQPYLDGINAFVHRLGLIMDKIDNEKPDVICFQEVIPFQLSALKRIMPDYSFYGDYNGKEDEPEGLFIAVNNNTAIVENDDLTTLSPTPQIRGSRFEGASPYPRILVMCQVKEIATNKSFRIYNTHLDHYKEEIRVMSVDIILSVMKKHNSNKGLPAILVGDLNAVPNSDSIKKLSHFNDVTNHLTSTFHGFGQRKDPFKIDYILMTDSIKGQPAIRWEDCHEGIYLSDHYPICTLIEL